LFSVFCNTKQLDRVGVNGEAEKYFKKDMLIIFYIIDKLKITTKNFI
jgi:hypothetical protein